MKYFSKKANPNETESFNSELMRRWDILVILLLFNSVAFGQITVHSIEKNNLNKIVLPSQIVEKSFLNDDSSTELKMGLVFWLMGSKQSQMNNTMDSTNKEKNSSSNSLEKKIFMDAGMSTKSVLYRTFFKKIINYGSTIT